MAAYICLVAAPVPIKPNPFCSLRNLSASPTLSAISSAVISRDERAASMAAADPLPRPIFFAPSAAEISFTLSHLVLCVSFLCRKQHAEFLRHYAYSGWLREFFLAKFEFLCICIHISDASRPHRQLSHMRTYPRKVCRPHRSCYIFCLRCR